MDEKRILRVLEKTDTQLAEKAEEVVTPKISHETVTKGQTNPLTKPILKNLSKFANVKIGDKLSVKDLLR